MNGNRFGGVLSINRLADSNSSGRDASNSFCICAAISAAVICGVFKMDLPVSATDGNAYDHPRVTLSHEAELVCLVGDDGDFG